METEFSAILRVVEQPVIRKVIEDQGCEFERLSDWLFHKTIYLCTYNGLSVKVNNEMVVNLVRGREYGRLAKYLVSLTERVKGEER